MIKRSVTPVRLLVVAFCLSLCSCAAPEKGRYIREADYAAPIRVACVGDSITYGAGIPERAQNSYPAQLARMLGNHWEVRNFGVSGSTLLKQGDRTYWKQRAYQEALEFAPDVVVIQLGTNDSKPQNWAHRDQFVPDYVDLIRSFQSLESRPRIWICRPAPAFPARWGISDQVIVTGVIPRVDAVATQTGVPVIDLHAALEGEAELFPDLIHPNAAGAAVMAQTICEALTGHVVPH